VIVDRVEVLKDGASSTYGADAIAGVINVITKKQFQGITVKAEGGDSQKGGASTVNASGLIGHGDLARDGYNFYIGTEYEHDSVLYSRDRGFPYNTNNFSSLCAPSLNGANTSGVNAAGITCRTNGIVNGIQFNNTFAGVGTVIVPVVRPYNAANTTALGNYQLLNPAAGCRGLTPVTVTTAQATRLPSRL
jgi:iron complex outermembrane receptor protein